MGGPSSKAACQSEIERLYSSISDLEIMLAQDRQYKRKDMVEYRKGLIASRKAKIKELKAKMKTLK